MRLAARALLPALVLATALAAPATAGAAAPVGSATLVVKPGAWRALAARGIHLDGAGGAQRQGRQVRLQLSGGTIGTGAAQLRSGGSLVLSHREGRRRQTVKLTGLRLQLGARSLLSAKLGGQRRPVLELNGPTPSIDASLGTAQVQGARLSWRPGIRRSLGQRLGAALPRGPLGTLNLRVATVLTETPKSGPVSGSAPTPTRPATAVDVTAATLSWHVRDSWIRYINTQEAPQTFEGATPEPAIPESSHPCPNRPASTNPTLVYSYDFPFASGWYDPPSHSAALDFNGGIRFSYPGHGIDITARAPEIEIGPASRAIFTLRGAAQTAYPEQRVALLELGAATPGETAPGSFSFPAPLRGTLSSDGQQVFAGFYPPPDDGFGCFDVSFNTGS